METIFALSSGAPPAAIAIVRISGPRAGEALRTLSGKLPEPRRAVLATLRDSSGGLLDKALVLWFPGPNSETGEDCAELQLHGGRAVVDAVCAELAALEGLRAAEPGEFTRRAFVNGRMDLLQVEGLADLVAAETELHRRAAMDLVNGKLSRWIDEFAARILHLSAQVEAALDFQDEDDVAPLGADFRDACNGLRQDMTALLRAPSADKIREGYRVALAGPPNSGKSTLFNALLDEEAAIVSSREGTTRDVLVRNVEISGIPVTLVDMAGLRTADADEIEAVGIEKARTEIECADLVLWLGPEALGPVGAWEIDAMTDRSDHVPKKAPDHSVSAAIGKGVGELLAAIAETARARLSSNSGVPLVRRQRELLAAAQQSVGEASTEANPLILAEHLRAARVALDKMTGRAGTEDMLDALFGRFCIGK